jgi:RHS repeat-associated protein
MARQADQSAHKRLSKFSTALFALVLMVPPVFGEEVPALKTDWVYFDGSFSSTGCHSSDSSAIEEKLARMEATEGYCQSGFTGWATDWPNGVTTTSYQFLCPPPNVPTGPHARKEERTARYDAATGTAQNCPAPTSRTTKINRQFSYYCADAANFDLVGIATTGGETVPVCRRKPGSVDPEKQPKVGCCTVGNPIELVSGEKIQRETDYVGSGAFPLSFTRSYLGGVWRHTYDRELDFGPLIDVNGYVRNQIRAKRPEGNSIPIITVGNIAEYPTDVVERLTAVYEASNHTGWKLKLSDDSVEIYDLDGRLLSISTRAGLTQTLSYDSSHRLSTVTDSFGRQLIFGYDGSDRLTSLTDPSGGVTEYDFDSQGRLVNVTYPNSESKTYVYDEAAHDASSSNVTLTGILDENGHRFATFEYDEFGRAITSEHAGGAGRTTVVYNANGSRDVTDASGVTRSYGITAYQSVGKLTGITGPACSNCGLSRANTYYTNGNLQNRTDFRGVTSNFGYTTDGRNLLTQHSEALSTSIWRATRMQWHPTFRLPTQIDLSNRRVTFTHDASGNILTRTVTDRSVTPNVSRNWTYTYNSNGQVLTEDGPRTDVIDLTTYTYYSCTSGYQCGQLHTITNALGHQTTFNTYNAHGQLTQVTDANGLVTSLGYDLRLRLTDRCVGGSLPGCSGGELTHLDYWPTGLLKKITNPDGSFIEYLYDAAHRLTEIKDGELNRIVYTLDAQGNRTAENTYDPSNTLRRTHTRVFNTLNQLWKDVNAAGTASVTTQYGYDDNSNLTTTSAPLGRNSSQTYDELNRLKQITNSNNGVTQFSYNAYDHLTSVTDPRNNVTSYTYNLFGNVKTQTSPDTGVTTNTYDLSGNLDTSTDSRTSISDYSYDAGNRATSVSFTKSGVTDQIISFGYDAGTNQHGRLTSAWDADHSLAWTYDTHGRVTGKGQTIGGVTLAVGYGYNASGQLGNVTLPSGNVVTFGYNANGRVSSLTLNSSTTILSNIAHDPFGPIAGWSWGNGSSASRAFDTDGKITQVDNANGASLKNYAYDDAFRITGITDAGNGALSWTYGYDLLDRLNSATSSSVTQGWTYDANGNRKTQTGTTPSTHTISSTNNRVASITGTPARSYTYDAAGNVLTFTGATFTYNNRGRMATAASGGVTATYTYNALGQRIRRATPSVTTLYVYDEAGHLTGEYTAAGALIQETVWLGDMPVATLRPNGSGGVEVFYVHVDHLKTPRLITDTANNIRWRWDSDPFGTTAPNENPSSLGSFVYNLRFPGQQYDGVVGLHYNYFRDYDPASGQYTQSDPIGLGGGLNTFSYGESDAISSTDPFGLSVYRGPGNYYSDVAPSAGCELAVFAGDALVAWIPCPEIEQVNDYSINYSQGAWEDPNCPPSPTILDLLKDTLKPDWTWAVPTSKLIKLAGVIPAAVKLASAANKLPGNARTTIDPQEVYRRLEKFHGIDPAKAGDRLHDIKKSANLGPADNVVFDLTGNVYDKGGNWLGSLTAGGG